MLSRGAVFEPGIFANLQFFFGHTEIGAINSENIDNYCINRSSTPRICYYDIATNVLESMTLQKVGRIGCLVSQ